MTCWADAQGSSSPLLCFGAQGGEAADPDGGKSVLSDTKKRLFLFSVQKWESDRCDGGERVGGHANETAAAKQQSHGDFAMMKYLRVKRAPMARQERLKVIKEMIGKALRSLVGKVLPPIHPPVPMVANGWQWVVPATVFQHIGLFGPGVVFGTLVYEQPWRTATAKGTVPILHDPRELQYFTQSSSPTTRQHRLFLWRVVL